MCCLLGEEEGGTVEVQLFERGNKIILSLLEKYVWTGEVFGWSSYFCAPQYNTLHSVQIPVNDELVASISSVIYITGKLMAV